MTVGKLDFYMGGSMIQAFSAVEKDIPTVVVAAHFQKEPQVLLSHPGQGLDRFEDLKRSSDILLSKDGFATFFQWMKAEFGFRDEQVKPYGFNPAPFIANKASVQQGYATSEPLTIEKAAGFKPNVFLLADYGFSTYSTTVETRREIVEKNPDLVQRFVDASTLGWYNYLYGDNRQANALIKRDNPEMTDELLAYSVARMKEYGIVDSGDAQKHGIGAMTNARMKDFFDKMVKAGLFKADLDYKKAYTLQFVNRGVGLELKK
jgi:NitT/TauT family transport system substrate-binding protein